MLALLISLLLFVVPLDEKHQETSFTSLEDLIHESQQRQLKPAILFTGSDWCKPCIRLEKEVLGRQDFKDITEHDILLYRADFPYHAKNRLPKETEAFNRLIADLYNIDGIFPLLVVLDNDQQVISRIGYTPSKGPAHFINILKSEVQ